MRKSLILTLVLFFSAIGSNVLAQPIRWEPLGGGLPNIVWELFADTAEGVLYAGGAFGTNFPPTPIRGIAKWDGIAWDSLGAGSYDPVYAITKYQGDIYMGGAFEKIGGVLVNGIARWNGSKWDSLGLGLTCCPDSAGPGSLNSVVSDLLVYNNELYVGGGFEYAGGSTPARGIAKWDGANWSEVGTFPVSDPSINALAEYNGDLYVAGSFGTGTSFRYIAKWNGTQWDSVGTGFYGGLASIMTLTTYQGELYAGGTFSKTGDSRNPGNYIAKWDGANWSEVGGGVIGADSSSNGQVWDMEVVDGELWVVGVFGIAGGIPAQTVAKWDGIEWCGVGSQFDWNPFALEALGNELYMGGGFLTIDGDTMRGIAKWIGGNYVDTCGVIVDSWEEIYSLEDQPIIYPNPTTGLVTVTGQPEEPERIAVYNTLGELVHDERLNVSNDPVIDLTGFPGGLYYLQVIQGQNNFKSKFIKL